MTPPWVTTTQPSAPARDAAISSIARRGPLEQRRRRAPSPPGRRCSARKPGQPASISARVSPSHSPAWRSRSRGSAATASRVRAASSAAVRRARSRSERPPAVDRRRAPTTTPRIAPAPHPDADSGGSAWPCHRPSAFHVDCPCRTRSSRADARPAPLAALTRRRRRRARTRRCGTRATPDDPRAGAAGRPPRVDVDPDRAAARAGRHRDPVARAPLQRRGREGDRLVLAELLPPPGRAGERLLDPLRRRREQPGRHLEPLGLGLHDRLEVGAAVDALVERGRAGCVRGQVHPLQRRPEQVVLVGVGKEADGVGHALIVADRTPSGRTRSPPRPVRALRGPWARDPHELQRRAGQGSRFGDELAARAPAREPLERGRDLAIATTRETSGSIEALAVEPHQLGVGRRGCARVGGRL